MGTGYLGPADGRTVRVLNEGGLDWDRPVFGRFGGFSGGMFGLLPVYCRAEGYDFDVIDHHTRAPGVGEASVPTPQKPNQVAALEGRTRHWDVVTPAPAGGDRAFNEAVRVGHGGPTAEKTRTHKLRCPLKDAIVAADLRNTQAEYLAD